MSSCTVTMCVPKINKTVRLAETAYDTPSPTEISSQDLASALPCLPRALPMSFLSHSERSACPACPERSEGTTRRKESVLPSVILDACPRRLSSTLVIEDLSGIQSRKGSSVFVFCLRSRAILSRYLLRSGHPEQRACPESVEGKDLLFPLPSSLYVFSNSLTIPDVSLCHSRFSLSVIPDACPRRL